MLLDVIKQDCLKATKDGNSDIKNLLKVVLGEVDRNKGSKEITDEVARSVLSKMIKNAEETIKMVPSQLEAKRKEIEILSTYLPKQLNEQETIGYINSLIQATSPVSMQNVMKALKANPQINMGLAAKLVKELVR